MTRCRIWAKGELLDGELLEFNDAKTCTVLIDGYQGSNTFDASCLVHQDAKILYMDAVDWAHEAVDVSIWPSQKMLLEGTPCAFECGVVRCEVRVIDWAHPQNFSLEQAEQEGPEARAKRYEGHIARYRQRIEAFQKTADLFRSERTEQCGVYQVVSNLERIRVNHADDGRVAEFRKSGKAYCFKDGVKTMLEDETPKVFKARCKDLYNIEFTASGYPQLLCPVCGGSDVTSAMQDRADATPFGLPIDWKVHNDTCRSCGEQGDFEGRNDALYSAAETEALKAEVQHLMLDLLNRKGVSSAWLERALGLPQRTMDRAWRKGEGLHSSAALLRLIHAQPHLVKEADDMRFVKIN